MYLNKLLLITGIMLLIVSCSTTEKFSVYVPGGTKVYTPNNPTTPSGIATASDKVDVVVPSDMYCGYILAQAAGSDVKVPIGLDYKTNRHTGAKAALYTGGTLTCVGIGTAMVGGIAMIAAASQGDEGNQDSFGMITAAGAAVGGVGALICMPAQGRLRQTAYDYNFGYEKKQRVNMPALSFTLLNPNSPKGYEEENAAKRESTSSRRKASSGKDVIAETATGSRVNKTRTDNAKKIVGTYTGHGTLFSGKNIDEKYSEISVIIERKDKNQVFVRIIENDEDYFDAPLVYEVRKNKNGSYTLNIDKLPEAVIQITSSGKLTFKHRKVNIENQIYTLEITADKD